MRILLALSFCLLATLALADQSTDSTGDYAMDLGQIYGGVLAVKDMEDICSEAFPATENANEVAYEKWRKRFLPFLQEVEKHLSEMAWREAKGDSQRHTEFLNKMEQSFEGYKNGLRNQMVSDGQNAFRKQCELYPQYLKTDRTNLENFYAEQVNTMRRGQTKKQ
ncbi:MAG: hypothetical protein IH613_10870 [Desulfuromonadales bacterium]|nr:hypothetical protein [Desulfuromonadales bacterium]